MYFTEEYVKHVESIMILILIIFQLLHLVSWSKVLLIFILIRDHWENRNVYMTSILHFRLTASRLPGSVDDSVAEYRESITLSIINFQYYQEEQKQTL